MNLAIAIRRGLYTAWTSVLSVKHPFDIAAAWMAGFCVAVDDYYYEVMEARGWNNGIS